MLASGKMSQMNGEDNRQDAADRRGDRLTERWITLIRNGSSTHIFVGARGLVTKGTFPLVGEPAEYLITDVADTEEDTAVPHQHQVYGQPPRSAMEVAIAVEVAPPDHYDGVN